MPGPVSREDEIYLDLLLSIITISLETMKIVRGLPRLTFDKSKKAP